MPDLNSLIVFARVVEANGFSKAARRLKMPTSTVSRRIAELEQELGVRLIERSTRCLRLTDVGSELLEHAQRSAEISEAIATLRRIICRMFQASRVLPPRRVFPTRYSRR
jgi:DNA-binding transcriptional LysR family regulator